MDTTSGVVAGALGHDVLAEGVGQRVTELDRERHLRLHHVVDLEDVQQLALDPPVGARQDLPTDLDAHVVERRIRLDALDQLAEARAVGVALDFAERNPGTLVVVTGDHETGGVSLVESDTTVELHYTTGGHTAGLVPLFAYGPQAERFGGYRENYEIGRLFLDIVRGW